MTPDEIRALPAPNVNRDSPSTIEEAWFKVAREAVAQLAEIKDLLCIIKQRGQGYHS